MTVPRIRPGAAATSAGSYGRPRQSRRRRVSSVLGVEWSPSYVAFVIYTFVIVGYRFPIGTEAMAVALVCLPMEPRPLRLPAPILWAIAFLAWAAVGWSSTAYPDVVWKEVIDLAKITAMMLVAVNVLTTPARLRFFMVAFLAFFAYFPARGGLLTYFLYHQDVQGRAVWNYIYSNPNDLASFCLLPLSLAIGMLFSERARWVRYCAGAGAVILPFVILLTQSRAAFLALSVLAVVILKGQKKRRGKILLLAGAAAVVVAFAAPSSVWTRLETITQVTNEQSAAKADDEGSARQRMEIWKIGWTIFRENPITGVGVGAYPNAHYVYAQRPVFDPIGRGPRDAHSTMLRILAETGFIGFVLYFGMIAATVYKAERTRRRAKATHPARATQIYYVEVGLLAYFVAGIWGSYGLVALTYLYVAVLYSMAQTLASELAGLNETPRGRSAKAARMVRMRQLRVAHGGS